MRKTGMNLNALWQGNVDESVTEADQRDCGSNKGKRTGYGSRSDTDSSHGRKS